MSRQAYRGWCCVWASLWLSALSGCGDDVVQDDGSLGAAGEQRQAETGVETGANTDAGNADARANAQADATPNDVSLDAALDDAGGDAAPGLLDASAGNDARVPGAAALDAAAHDAGSADAAAPGPITIWLAGDSTVAKGLTPCPVGWGASFAEHFRSGVGVVNGAVGGRSVNTWLYQVTSSMGSDGECVLMKDGSGQPLLQARWQAMLDGMKPGDYLFVQFGINDSAATCDRHVGIEAFKKSYGSMAQAAKQRGAQPVFVTPVSAIACSGSAARGSRGEYVTATLDVGKALEVPVIDLHQRSVDLYNQRKFCPIAGGDVSASASSGGPAGDFFCDDHTHFSALGAPQIGALVAQAIREQKLALSAYLK